MTTRRKAHTFTYDFNILALVIVVSIPIIVAFYYYYNKKRIEKFMTIEQLIPFIVMSASDKSGAFDGIANPLMMMFMSERMERDNEEQ